MFTITMRRLTALSLLPLLFACQTPVTSTLQPTVPQSSGTGFEVIGGQEFTTQVPPTLVPTQERTATPLPAAAETPEQTVDSSGEQKPSILLAFTGQIVPGRCVQAEVDAHGSADYIYEDVSDILTQVDWAIGTLNAALSDYAPQTGCVETFVLVGSSNNADAMADAGIDMMSVATNHIKNCSLTNCGDIAFFDTLDNLNRVGIVPVGAGINLEEASRPVYVEIRGITFGFVSLGEIEPLAFAGEDSPGIGILTEDTLVAEITEAKENADVVIFMPHWGPEYTHKPNPIQLRFAKIAVSAGADLVIGNHTHYIQGYEMLNGVPVFYGLGNFVFDQTQERQRQQSVVLRVHFEGDEFVTFELIPTINEKNGTIHIANQNEAVEIFKYLRETNEGIR